MRISFLPKPKHGSNINGAMTKEYIADLLNLFLDFESKRDFVVTTSLRPQLQALALAVSEGQSVLLEGTDLIFKETLVKQHKC